MSRELKSNQKVTILRSNINYSTSNNNAEEQKQKLATNNVVAKEEDSMTQSQKFFQSLTKKQSGGCTPCHSPGGVRRFYLPAAPQTGHRKFVLNGDLSVILTVRPRASPPPSASSKRRFQTPMPVYRKKEQEKEHSVIEDPTPTAGSKGT